MPATPARHRSSHARPATRVRAANACGSAHADETLGCTDAAAAMQLVAPAPSPPSIVSVLSEEFQAATSALVNVLHLGGGGPTLADYLQPLVSLFAAFSMAVATTDRVRQAMRPGEVALQNRLAIAAAEARDAAEDALEGFYDAMLLRYGYHLVDSAASAVSTAAHAASDLAAQTRAAARIQARSRGRTVRSWLWL